MTTRVAKGRRTGGAPSFLASRGFATRHSRVHALPSLNLKKKRDCSQSSFGTIRDICLKWTILSTISFIYYFILFKRRKSSHPRINVVWSKRKTWGSKRQHWFWGEGWGWTGERDTYVHYAKKAILQKFLNTFVPHCSFPDNKIDKQYCDKQNHTGHLLEQWHPIHLQSKQALMILGCQSGQQNSLQLSWLQIAIERVHN